MRSVRRTTRGGSRRAGLLWQLALAACVCLLGAGAAGCSTTQEKAAAQKIESERILKEQAEQKQAKKRAKAKAQHAKHHHEKGGGK